MTDIDQPAAHIVRADGLADQAYAVLRQEILVGVLPPGTRLSVPDVARRLAISRSPAREAITRIQYDGLADFEPNRGAVVSRIDLQGLREIYEVREVLEGLAARLATRRSTPALLARLDAVWSQHEDAVRAADEQAHVRLDGEFHLLIRAAAANARVADALDRLQGQIRLAMATTAHRGGGMSAALAEHRAILDAITSGDDEAAERVSRAHISRLQASLVDASAGLEREAVS